MDKLLKAFHISWPFAALLIAHLIWGGNFIAAKLTLNEIPPQSLAFLRFTLATLFLIPFLISDPKSLKISKADLPKLFLVGSLMVTLHIAFFFEGLKRTNVTDASALMLTVPILSVILGWWFFKEKVTLINLTGVVFGLIGALLIVGVADLVTQRSTNSNILVGNFLIILSTITWVIGAMLSKKLLHHYSTLTVTWVMFLVGVITFFIPAVNEYIQNPDWVSRVSLLGIIGLSYITLGSSVSAYFLFEWGVKKVGVIKADLFQYIEPVVAGGLAILILSEKLETTFIIGAIFVAIGAILGTYSRHIKHFPHKAHRG